MTVGKDFDLVLFIKTSSFLFPIIRISNITSSIVNPPDSMEECIVPENLTMTPPFPNSGGVIGLCGQARWDLHNNK